MSDGDYKMDNKNHSRWTSKDVNLARQEGWLEGKEYCKKEVLKILKENWTGADLSINSCDEYYIDKINREI